jgi:hypothetical protein
LLVWETFVHLSNKTQTKTNIMETQNTTIDSKSTSNNQNVVFIEWGNEKTIVAQFKTIDELVSAGYVAKYASNFGYEHLVDRSLKNWANVEIHHVFVTSANPKFNYGLDFNIWINYTVGGINFMKQLNIGSASLTSAPLQRVMMHTAIPAGLDLNNLQNNSPEIMAEWAFNMKNNIFESFSFSMNAFYKKDSQFRAQLVELCSKYQFIFA